jgi:6-phosphogluconolactonase
MNDAPVRMHIYRDAEEVAAEVTAWLHHLASASTGRFSVCLSGGSTPKLLYETLAQPPYLDRFPWQRVHWFWGDERFVPPAHPDSNYRMVRVAMLDAVPVPPENIHPVNTGLVTPRAAADDYERTLLRFNGSELSHPAKTLFDIVLLGVGDDGHTASLFPGSPALDETTRWVVPVIGTRPDPRITLTFPALRSSGHIAFLACGAKKRHIVSETLAGKDLPAGRVRSDGAIHWFLDQVASPFDESS